MGFIDWCHAVLTEVVRLCREDPTARSLGVHDTSLGRVLFPQPADASQQEPTPDQTMAIFDALGALVRCGLLTNDQHWWKVTRLGQAVADDPVGFWQEICATRLDADQRQLLELVNRLSPHSRDGFARIETADASAIIAEAPDLHARGLLHSVAHELHDLGFLVDRGGIGEVAPRATYTGLVWETKRGLTIDSQFIDELVAEWETTSVDFKQELHTNTKDEKVELVKDVLSLATTKASGRRWLIIGFHDKTHAYYGPPDPKLTQNHLEQLLSVYTRPVVKVRYDEVTYRAGLVGRLEVYRDPAELPYRVARDLRGDKREMKAGEVYVRHGSQRVRLDPHEEEYEALEEEARRARGPDA